MLTWAKYIIGVICLLIVGVVLAVGLMTIFFAPSAGAFTLKTSADAAGWFQAVGSVIAIGGAFLVGKHQAEAAHKSAVELEEIRRQHRERGADSLQERLLFACDSAISTIDRSTSAEDFRSAWQDSAGPTFQTAIHAFDNMPLFEVCSPQRIEVALRIREVAGEISRMGERACPPSSSQTIDQSPWLHMKSAHRKFVPRVRRLKADLHGIVA